MPEALLGFQKIQQQMTDWLREPDTKPAPAVELRRLMIYRELFFNNVRDFVESAYPVFKSFLPEAEWDALVLKFFAEHRCTSPYFRDISLAFREWFEQHSKATQEKYPWAIELLHFEWVELAADCAEADVVKNSVQPSGISAQIENKNFSENDLLNAVPVLQDCVWPLVYRWPVHEFAQHYEANNLPPSLPLAQPVCLLVYRDSEESVRYLKVNFLGARAVELLQHDKGMSGRDIWRKIAQEVAPAESDDFFMKSGAEIFAVLQEQQVIRDFRAL